MCMANARFRNVFLAAKDISAFGELGQCGFLKTERNGGRDFKKNKQPNTLQTHK